MVENFDSDEIEDDELDNYDEDFGCPVRDANENEHSVSL